VLRDVDEMSAEDARMLQQPLPLVAQHASCQLKQRMTVVATPFCTLLQPVRHKCPLMSQGLDTVGDFEQIDNSSLICAAR
jgi:hypothetical protein